MKNEDMIEFCRLAVNEYGKGCILNKEDIKYLCNKYPTVKYPHWLINGKEYRHDRGLFKVPYLFRKEEEEEEQVVAAPVATVVEEPEEDWEDDDTPGTLVPRKFKGYVPFGFYKDLRKILEKKMFYPVFISGWSGNGKTLMAEQVCSQLRRELIRINISPETDATDLLGGPTLVDGNVVYREGPVLIAMKKGAVLLLDEVDRGSSKLLCLQGILEGKPYYNKFTNELIYPAAGFTIIATANTKGRGDEEGKYLAQILDDAFLERYALTVEQEFPPQDTELKILSKEMEKLSLLDDDSKEFANLLVNWSSLIRKSCEENSITEVISTRRLVFICQSYSIFQDRLKAIRYCINRFDDVDKKAFLDFYTAIDKQVAKEKADAEVSKHFMDLSKPEVDHTGFTLKEKTPSLDVSKTLQEIADALGNQVIQNVTLQNSGAGYTMPGNQTNVDLENILDPEKWLPKTLTPEELQSAIDFVATKSIDAYKFGAHGTES